MINFIYTFSNNYGSLSFTFQRVITSIIVVIIEVKTIIDKWMVINIRRPMRISIIINIIFQNIKSQMVSIIIKIFKKS